MNPLLVDLKLCQLTALPLELHFQIFSNLQPYDMFQVRQTCRALYLAASERVVWMDTLHRICVENTLFEPSFPIASMSVLELQRASMGPHHWIARSSSQERNLYNVLPHRAMRRLMLPSSMDGLFIGEWESLDSLYLVPGGRYLFSFSCDWMALWDLGSPYSSDKEPYIIATESVVFFGLYLVHSTPDGLGLRIFISHPIPYDMASFSIYEIYPESTSPQITQIAHTRVPNSHSDMDFYSLSYDRLIFHYRDILTIWDFKANTWARWVVKDDYNQIIVTKSTLTLIRTYGTGVSVWKIPPLLPESSMSTNPPVISAAFELDYPEGHIYPQILQAPCDWYSGSPQPLYYDLLEDTATDPIKISRFEVTINSNISSGALNLLKTFEVPLNDAQRFCEATRICQDKNISICIDDQEGFLGSYVSDIYDQQPHFLTPLSYNLLRNSANVTFCPVAGRVVYSEGDGWLSGIIILDF